MKRLIEYIAKTVEARYGFVAGYRVRNWRNEVNLVAQDKIAGNVVKMVNKLPIVGGGVTMQKSRLHIRVLNADGSLKYNLGVVGGKVITTVAVNAIRDAHIGTYTLSNMKYHHWGTGNTAEAVGDTGLVTPSAESRSTGTQVSGGTGAYQSVATITATGTRAIVEHGLFSATSAGDLYDRTVHSVVNLVSGESIQYTYTSTFSAGG